MGTHRMAAPPLASLWSRFEGKSCSAGGNLVTSCSCYMISSAGMSVFNKLAVQSLGLPITLVLIQMLFTVFTVMLRPRSVHIGSMRDALQWGLTVPLLFAAMLVRRSPVVTAIQGRGVPTWSRRCAQVSSIVAMQYNSLGTIVIFRNIAPLFTLGIESMFRIPMQITRDTVAALVTIVLGVVCYHYSTLTMSAIGLAAICLNMAFAVLERLMQRHLMAQEPVDISKPGMMLLNNLFGLLPCGVLLLVYQEVPHWSTVSSTLTYAECMLIGASCLNGLAISYAGLRVQQLVTATTFMVLTNINKFVVIIFGVVALHDPLSARSAFGVLLAMGGGVWYAQARAKAPEEKKEQLLPLQNLKRATNLISS